MKIFLQHRSFLTLTKGKLGSFNERSLIAVTLELFGSHETLRFSRHNLKRLGMVGFTSFNYSAGVDTSAPKLGGKQALA